MIFNGFVPKVNPIRMITCVILAGGKSRRMGGRPKALLLFRKKTFIGRVIDSVRPYTKNVVVVGGTGRMFKSFGVRHIKDYWPGAGL